jgi:large subunit ribosomal protein L21
MYAVIETGGKQYRVELGTELAVERLDALPGSTVDFDRVLLVADGEKAQIGTPIVADALVTADVLRQDRGEKIIVFKYRPKARHRSKKGHRQEQTVLRIADIRFDGRSAADEAGTQKQDKQAELKAAQVEADKKAAADQALAAKLAAEAAPKAEAATDAKPATKTTTRKPAAAKETTTAKAPAAKAATAAKPATKSATAKAVTAAPKTTTTKTATAKTSTKTPAKAADAGDDKPKTTRSRAAGSSTKKDE